MVSCITLLLPCLLVILPTCHAKPVPFDNMKRMVQIVIKTIDAQVKEYSTDRTVAYKLPDYVPGKQPIQGLGSVVQSLKAFQRMDSVLNAQLKLHLSSLSSYLEHYAASLQCPTSAVPASFEKLDSFMNDYQGFDVTLGMATLNRLKEYMGKVLLSVDTLKTC